MQYVHPEWCTGLICTQPEAFAARRSKCWEIFTSEALSEPAARCKAQIIALRGWSDAIQKLPWNTRRGSTKQWRPVQLPFLQAHMLLKCQTHGSIFSHVSFYSLSQFPFLFGSFSALTEGIVFLWKRKIPIFGDVNNNFTTPHLMKNNFPATYCVNCSK